MPMKKATGKNLCRAALVLAALLLGSCSFSAPGTGELKPALPELSVSASPYAGPAAGEYFNALQSVSLRLDGAGAFVLSSEKGRAEGTYTATEEELLLLCGGEELRAAASGEGFVLQGLGGIFLPAEHREDFSAMGLSVGFDREYTEQDDGSYTLCDYVLGLGLSYPQAMSAPENLISDAVVVWDRSFGYVTGRNVTGEFFGEAEDFMSDYMSLRVLTDFRLLYGAEGSYENMEMLDEGISGRISSAEGTIASGEKRVYVKAIMYTSTYADGTVNYICKCFFAPEGDTGAFNTLANSVTDMTAVRRR